jgi:ubiquitin carboxyl-terminal hydrolase L3
MSTQTSAAAKSWLPCESNPEVFNEYASRLGWPTETLAFADLLSMDEWATSMLPVPVRAVAMLYLIKPCHEEYREAEEEIRAAAAPLPVASTPLFIRQEIANACGTLALLHCLASVAAAGDVTLATESWLAKFLDKSKSLDPDERAALLSIDEEIEVEQATAVAGGQSEQVDDTWQHFVAFVETNGRLFELDGRKGGPIDHGPTTRERLLDDAISIMRKYMERDPEELRFTMLALCPPIVEDEE